MSIPTKTDSLGRAVRPSHPLAINPKDGSVFVQVPSGEFEMGDGMQTNCPKKRVWLDTYYIAIYCVTNRQYAQFVKETGHQAPEHADYGDAV